MTDYYGMLKLKGPKEWEQVVGSAKWKPKRSAYELAHAWHGAPRPPQRISELLDASGVAHFAGLKLDLCIVEQPTFLDSRKGPSFTDLVAYATNDAGKSIVLGVEGKATEPFGPIVQQWLSEGGETRRKRLSYLCEILGIKDAATTRQLRYQLLHRTSATALEAAKAGADAAAVIVHSFARCDDNKADYEAFLQLLGVKSATLAGPVRCRPSPTAAMPVYFAWVDQPVP